MTRWRRGCARSGDVGRVVPRGRWWNKIGTGGPGGRMGENPWPGRGRRINDAGFITNLLYHAVLTNSMTLMPVQHRGEARPERCV